MLMKDASGTIIQSLKNCNFKKIHQKVCAACECLGACPDATLDENWKYITTETCLVLLALAHTCTQAGKILSFLDFCDILRSCFCETFAEIVHWNIIENFPMLRSALKIYSQVVKIWNHTRFLRIYG